MRSRQWSAENAYAFVKDRRQVIRPNKGFLRQLETFEGILNASSNRLSFKIRRNVEVDDNDDRHEECGEDGDGEDGDGDDVDAV